MMAASAPTTAKTKQDSCIVRIAGLTKKYRNGTAALNGIDLSVREGDMFGIIGPDGAGKTTLLQIIAGVMEPSQGTIKVLGKPARDSREKIGYLPQVTPLYPDLTVDENLIYEAGLRGVSDKDFKQRRDSLLKQVGLDRFKDRLASDLSGGMKQKLSLSCALIAQPKLLLLDEPTTGLDPIARQELWRALTKSVADGMTLIVATPSLEEAEYCNQVALAYEGSVHDTGSPEELEESLGLTRVELLFKDAKGASSATQRIEKAHLQGVVDILTFGDQAQILFKTKENLEKQIREAIGSEAEDIQPQWCQVTKPNLETVFTMRLRALGHGDKPPPPMPRLHCSKSNSGKDADGSAESDGSKYEVAIKAKGLSRSFGDFHAVKDISLEVKYGQILGLLGANGAGKTTTIKMLAGVVEPSSGEVTIAGEKSKLRSRRVRQELGYMSQKFTLYDGLTVLENLEFYASIFDIPRDRRKEKIDWALSACGLADKARVLVRSLPRGWKQRIAFGASVLHEPTILFLDEPTAGVDPIARRQLWIMIRDMADKGAAVLVSTHLLEEAANCDNLAFMNDGRCVAKGSPGEIKESQENQEGLLLEIKTRDKERVLQCLEKEFEPWRVSIKSGNLHIILDNGENDRALVEQKLNEAKVEVDLIRPIPYRLDDAFISIIQHSRKDSKDDKSAGSSK